MYMYSSLAFCFFHLSIFLWNNFTLITHFEQPHNTPLSEYAIALQPNFSAWKFGQLQITCNFEWCYHKYPIHAYFYIVVGTPRRASHKLLHFELSLSFRLKHCVIFPWFLKFDTWLFWDKLFNFQIFTYIDV
jgi:hypothetical protein